jgi:Uma2 family endonuclease
MSVVHQETATTIEYPESDGKPMGETDVHIELIINLRCALRDFFRNAADVYVGSNLVLYYVEGDPAKRIEPDVFFVRGVGKGARRVYKLWEEGRPPDVVFEISSRGTWQEDLQKKWQLYAQLGVREYFIFDPERDYLIEPLVGYRLEDGQYVRMEVEGGRLRSKALGLELVDTGETLRLYDPQAERFLPTPAEESESLRAEAAARRQAEAEANQLREELERLRRAADVK